MVLITKTQTKENTMDELELNWLEKRILKSIIRRAVLQGRHVHKVTELYRLITVAWRKEFTEDNKPTGDIMLAECHKNSLDGF